MEYNEYGCAELMTHQDVRRNKMKSKNTDPVSGIAGEWTSVDPFGSDVVYTIEKIDSVYSVSAVDSNEGEHAEIFEVKWNEEKSVLSFSAHWESTGRFLKCKIMLVERDKLSFTYTYTDSDILIRKSKSAEPSD